MPDDESAPDVKQILDELFEDHPFEFLDWADDRDDVRLDLF